MRQTVGGRWRPAVAAAAIAVAVVACTDAPSHEADGGTVHGALGDASEVAAFADAYDDVSAEFQEAVDAVKEQGRVALEAGDDSQVQAVYRGLLDATAEARRKYESITAPPGLVSAVEELTHLLAGQQEALEGILVAAEANDGASVAAGLQELATLMVDWSNTHRGVAQQLTADGS